MEAFEKHLTAIFEELADAKRDACKMQAVVDDRDETIRARDEQIVRLKAQVAKLAVRHAVMCN